MAKAEPKASEKPQAVSVVYVGDGLLDVPAASLLGIAPGVPFDVAPEVAECLLADATVSIELANGGKKA